ncbi:EF-hand and coiled-coil domain-containing protein 1 [Trichomycterus rosablanca]|uniref:EF-hand and coiled-coil domain-containing protein 1 n=1 Tax=Trichomycterus rosablanca TaxID=2290929 RepID=UPI002F351428
MAAPRSCGRQPIRAARKSEWLRGALAHHYSPDLEVENEIVVLATGIDQYLQEVFHHLSYCSRGDLVSDQDFRLLCSVMGINPDQDGGSCADLPPALNFREFHARLCGSFSLKAGPTRLALTEETEHVEREIKLRCPRVRRRKCVSFDLSRQSTGKRTTQSESAPESTEPGPDSQQRTWQEHVEVENSSLRELVEDLRSALQSSDARCISLEVALRKERLAAPTEKTPQIVQRQGYSTQSKPSTRQTKQTRRTKDLFRELDLIRASRNGQLEEAMKYNQRLEEELIRAHEEVSRLEAMVGKLRRESADIRRRAEEARGALAAGLERVRDIQDQALQVMPLQERAQSLEAELKRFRSQCSCKHLSEHRPEPLVRSTHRVLPTGQDKTLIRGAEEALQRAVEGRAASDEEEERTDEEDQCCLLEVKRLTNRLHNCPKGCQKMAVCQLLMLQNFTGHYSGHSRHSGAPELKTRGRRHQTLLSGKETEKNVKIKQEEVNSMSSDVQMVDTGRTRLSLLEEKLMDALSLLLQLRDKRMSRRTLGKILLDTLDQCNRKGQESTPVCQVVDTLCQQLVSSDLQCEEEKVISGLHPSVTSHHQKANKTLLISC